MKTVTLPLPIFGFVVATRAAGAFGAGLLASLKIPEDRRRRLGLLLVALGAATTVPAIVEIRRRLAA